MLSKPHPLSNFLSSEVAARSPLGSSANFFRCSACRQSLGVHSRRFVYPIAAIHVVCGATQLLAHQQRSHRERRDEFLLWLHDIVVLPLLMNSFRGSIPAGLLCYEGVLAEGPSSNATQRHVELATSGLSYVHPMDQA